MLKPAMPENSGKHGESERERERERWLLEGILGDLVFVPFSQSFYADTCTHTHAHVHTCAHISHMCVYV